MMMMMMILCNQNPQCASGHCRSLVSVTAESLPKFQGYGKEWQWM